MNKFKKATKRIAAVAASTAMISASVFGVGLSDYPNNFITDDKFEGQIVIGANSAPQDTTAAQSIIEDLKAQFSGDQEQVEITYKQAANGGKAISATRSNEDLNYAETIGDSTEKSGFDDDDTSVLADEKFDNGISDEDYSQEILLENGIFNYALRDDVDGIDEITDGIYYDNKETFAVYTLTFDNAIDLSDTTDLDEDFIGKTLKIMGNDFTIASISADGLDVNKLELIGGANKISLGEGESSTVNIDGVGYTIEVESVNSEKVLLSVNGVTESIDEFDTEDVGGISIAITDLVDSSRDSVKGYAEIVVGGQKITLEDGDKVVEVNEEDVDEVYEGYIIKSDFSNGEGFESLTITYQVDDEVLLQAGDSLIDPLFQAFSIVFNGVNNVDYEELKLSVSTDDIDFDGTLENGNDFSRAFIHTTAEGDDGTGALVYLKGEDDEDIIFHAASIYLTAISGVAFYDTSGDITIASEEPLGFIDFNFSVDDYEGSGLFLYNDAEEQFLYEFSSIDTNDAEVDVEEQLDDKDKSNLSPAEFLTDLEVTLDDNGQVVNTSTINLTVSDFGLATLSFANELLVDFSLVETDDIAVDDSVITFSLNTGDVDVDSSGADETESYDVTLSWDTSDEEFDLVLDDTNFVNLGDADLEDGDSDVQTYVTVYGTKITYDSEDNKWIKIEVPDEQVKADVELVFGGVAAQTSTKIVAEDQLDAEKAKLEEEGYTIVGIETVLSEEVEFDISAPVIDNEVIGNEDLIVVGGPAVNSVARDLLEITSYDESLAGVNVDEAVIRYFEDTNSVLVYGYEAKDTQAAVDKLNTGGLAGTEVNVQ